MNIRYIIILSLLLLTNVYCLNCKSAFITNDVKLKQVMFKTMFNSYDNIDMQASLFYEFIPEYKKIITYVKDNNRDYGYNINNTTYHHILTSMKNVDKVFYNDKCTLRIIMFFHDLGKYKPNLPHEIVSADICKQTLTALKFEEDYIDLCYKIILHHSDLAAAELFYKKIAYLSEDEITLLYYVTLCDITDRKYFDTKSNIFKIRLMYNLIISASPTKLFNVLNILASMSYTISGLRNLRKLISDSFETYFYVKNLAMEFYVYKIGFFDIKSYKNFMISV